MARSFNPGDYRHKVDILKPPTTQDAYGELDGEWAVYKTLWASKEPLLGNEYFNALTTDTKVEVKYNMRYSEGITDKMRIKHGTEVYEILSVINVKSLNQELLCYCRLVK